MGTLIFLIIVASIVLLVVARRGEVLRFETLAAPSQVVMAATASVATGRRWSVAHQTSESAVYSYHRKPNMLIALFLMLFFFVPGLVYLVLAGKSETLSLHVDRSTGNSLVQITSNGMRGKSAGRGVQTQMGVGAGTGAVLRHPGALPGPQGGYGQPQLPDRPQQAWDPTSQGDPSSAAPPRSERNGWA